MTLLTFALNNRCLVDVDKLESTALAKVGDHDDPDVGSFHVDPHPLVQVRPAQQGVAGVALGLSGGLERAPGHVGVGLAIQGHGDDEVLRASGEKKNKEKNRSIASDPIEVANLFF